MVRQSAADPIRTAGRTTGSSLDAKAENRRAALQLLEPAGTTQCFRFLRCYGLTGRPLRGAAWHIKLLALVSAARGCPRAGPWRTTLTLSKSRNGSPFIERGETISPGC
jgi:hypothetical protein